MNYVFIFLGRSGVGKDSIFRRVVKDLPYLTKILPITTRPQRKYEQDGRDYQFVSEDTFQDMILKNALLEYREYRVKNQDNTDDIWFYGHPSGKNELYSAMIGTPAVCMTLYRNPSILVIPILITAPNEEELFHRMAKREQKQDNPNMLEVERRYISDKKDFDQGIIETIKSQSGDKFFEVVNDNMDIAVQEVETFIKHTIERNEVYGKRERM